MTHASTDAVRRLTVDSLVNVSRTTLRLTVGGDAWMPEGGPSTAVADPTLADDGEDGPDGRGMTDCGG